MAVSFSCKCGERHKPAKRRAWAVYQRMCNHSAFNGRRFTPSDYSDLVCHVCGAVGRTKAGYVKDIPDFKKFDQNSAVKELARIGDKQNIPAPIPAYLLPLFEECGATKYQTGYYIQEDPESAVFVTLRMESGQVISNELIRT